MTRSASCQVYYKAKSLAMNNGRTYHIAAVLKRGKNIVRIGENTNKTAPRFKRQYKDGTWGSHMHAEMNVLRFAKPGDTLDVMRFSSTGEELTMAKPCELCMKFIKESKIKKVRYTDWDGNWNEFEVEK
jgi:tRNA(Arg) A34 adenosine deaminase TadA